LATFFEFLDRIRRIVSPRRGEWDVSPLVGGLEGLNWIRDVKILGDFTEGFLDRNIPELVDVSNGCLAEGHSDSVWRAPATVSGGGSSVRSDHSAGRQRGELKITGAIVASRGTPPLRLQ